MNPAPSNCPNPAQEPEQDHRQSAFENWWNNDGLEAYNYLDGPPNWKARKIAEIAWNDGIYLNTKQEQPEWSYSTGQHVRKKSGSEWDGVIVGFYSSGITPRGYCVESSKHKGSVQIYPESALELVK